MRALHHKARKWHSRLGTIASGGLLSLGIAACEKPPVQPPKATAHVRVRAFVEAGPVRAMVLTPGALFVAMQEGIDRIDLTSGARQHMASPLGLPGSEVYAMAYDGKELVWIASDQGISRLSLATLSFEKLPSPPEIFQVGMLSTSVLAPAPADGLWLGTAAGLFLLSATGQWSQTAISTQVTGLVQDAQGTLWIGTTEGLVSVGEDRVALELGTDAGCGFARISALSPHGPDTVLVLGENAEGRSLLALARQQACTSFAAPNESRWRAIASGAGESYLLSDEQIERIDTDVSAGTGSLLRALSDKAQVADLLHLQPMSVKPPADPLAFVAGQGELFIATADLGVMRASGSGEQSWLRSGELAAGARTLSVACAQEADCYIALGDHRLWHWRGTNFVNEGSGEISHFVTRLADGRLLLIRQAGSSGAPMAELFLLADGQWQGIAGLALETPGEQMRIRTVRQGPDGLLWVSLAYDDGPGDPSPFGIAAIDLEMGTVWYHRASFDEGAAGRGIVPVPVDVTGIAFLGSDEVWLASSQGAARVVGDEVKTFIEADGLLSEILSSVVTSSGGMVYAASGKGVGEYDGRAWKFPPPLRTAIYDLAIGQDGSLWLATDHGIGIYDGQNTRRLDARRGLLDDKIRDLETDSMGRIWALSEQGLTLVTP